MNRHYILALLLLLPGLLHAQPGKNDILFSAHIRDLPFTEFMQVVEQNTGARFYYLAPWFGEVRITVSGDSLSLRTILASSLLPEGYQFYISNRQEIFLTEGTAIVTELPDYTNVEQSPVKDEGGQARTEVTITEQRYIEGRKLRIRETLVVGQKPRGGAENAYVVYGKIADRETGESLIGATIYVHELEKGAATNANGRFSIVLPPARYTVDFSCMGMEAEQYYLDVRGSGSMDIRMEKVLIPISEVVVQADRYHNVKGSQMGYERIDYKMIKQVPIVLGEKDILKVARLLPGVQSVGEGSSGFNVRGSGADQNMIYVNRVPVYNSSHLFGFFSSLNPDIVKDFSLYKSNLPARFGGRLSSFFEISTRQGNMSKYTARGGISPVTGHVALEGPLVKNKSSFVLSARSSYSDWLLKQMHDPELRNSDASFYDLAGTLTYEPGNKDLVRIFGYYSRDNFALGNTNTYDYSNSGASILLDHRFNSRLSSDMAAVFSRYSFQTQDRTLASYAYRQDYQIDHYEIKADFTWLSLGAHRINFGANGIYYRLNRGRIDPLGEASLRIPVNLGIEDGVETAFYIADEINPAPNWTIFAGLRYAFFAALGPSSELEYGENLPHKESNITDTLHFDPGDVVKHYSGLEPRLAVKYLLSNHNSVKLSYNRTRQFLFMLSNTIAISPTDQWKLCDYNIVPPHVDQVSAGYYHDFQGQGISSSLEVYHKWVVNVLEYRDGASFINSPRVEMQTMQGRQKAYGIELMLKKSRGKFNGWISYCYSRSLMEIGSEFPEESINEGRAYASNYDRPHNLNLVSNYRVNRRLSLSANMVYITGRPVTYPVSIYYSEGIEYLYYSARNAYRIPDYFRVDLSINLEGNLLKRKVAHSYWMLSFYNLSGRKNAYSVYFKSEEGQISGYRLSIFGRPVITLSWNFKFGNYASE